MYKCTSMKQSWKKRRSRAAETLLCWEYKRAMEVLTMDSACGQFSRQKSQRKLEISSWEESSCGDEAAKDLKVSPLGFVQDIKIEIESTKANQMFIELGMLIFSWGRERERERERDGNGQKERKEKEREKGVSGSQERKERKYHTLQRMTNLTSAIIAVREILYEANWAGHSCLAVLIKGLRVHFNFKVFSNAWNGERW